MLIDGGKAVPAQPPGEGDHRRRLAGLAGGVHDEVELLLDVGQQIGDALLGPEHEVVFGVAGAGDVEEARHVLSLTARPRSGYISTRLVAVMVGPASGGTTSALLVSTEVT